MKIDQIRVYAEVLEQGIDFKEYIQSIDKSLPVINVYTKKARGEITSTDSLIERIRKSKDVDVLLTVISDKKEYPLLMVEYSTAVPTDDHKMQRSDVYYWSGTYKTPMMKIYPDVKGMSQDFGGGDKFSDELETALSYKKGAIFYPIKWDTLPGFDTLKTKDNALSCIYFSEEIKAIMQQLICCFRKEASFSDYYDALRNAYYLNNKKIIDSYNKDKIKKVIVDSSRFKWSGDKLISKINRFGHAMDPDRGVLYFTNMLVGIDNCITEIQVNRESVNGRGGYKSLFDAASRETVLRKYVDNIIKKANNVFKPADAIYIFETALCIENWKLFKQVTPKQYQIDDKKLKAFLEGCQSMTSKCIFYLSSELILTDKDRKTICSIKWSSKIVNNYLATLNANIFTPTKIKELTLDDCKEDIITFASVELYKMIKCQLVAVSYPGAQGDRCVLYGEGRNVLRTYIDIIALKQNAIKATVFLEECKDNISKSKDDATKLNNFISTPEQIDGLKALMNKVIGTKAYNEIKISVGAKYSKTVPLLNVDYIFMFDIDNNTKGKTLVDYSVALIDTTLLHSFAPLMNKDKKLKGRLEYDKLYVIE